MASWGPGAARALRVFFCAAAVGAVLGAGAEGRAGCLEGLTMWWPPPGATQVPTDTTLVFDASGHQTLPLVWSGGEAQLETVWSFRTSGECVSTVFVQRPMATLAPQTTYELAPGSSAVRAWSPPGVGRTFTTGAGPAGAQAAGVPGLHLYLVDSGFPQGTMGGDSEGVYTGYAVVRTEVPDAGTVLVTARAPAGKGRERRVFLVTPNEWQETDLFLPVLLDGRPCIRVDAWTMDGTLLHTEDLCEPELCAPKPQDEGEWAVDWAQVSAGSCEGVPAGVPYTKAAAYDWYPPGGEAAVGPGSGLGEDASTTGCAASPVTGAPAWLLLTLPWLVRRRMSRRASGPGAPGIAGCGGGAFPMIGRRVMTSAARRSRGAAVLGAALVLAACAGQGEGSAGPARAVDVAQKADAASAGSDAAGADASSPVPDAALADAQGQPCDPHQAGAGSTEGSCPAGYGCLTLDETCRLLETGLQCLVGPPSTGLALYLGWWPESDPAPGVGTVTALQVGGVDSPVFGAIVTLDDGREVALKVQAPSLALALGQRVTASVELFPTLCTDGHSVDLHDEAGGLLLRSIHSTAFAPPAPTDTIALSLADVGCGAPASGCGHAIPAGVAYEAEDGTAGLVPPDSTAGVSAGGGAYDVHAGASWLAADPCGYDCIAEDYLSALAIRRAAPPMLEPWEPAPATGAPPPSATSELQWLTALATEGGAPVAAVAPVPGGGVVVAGAGVGDVTAGQGAGSVVGSSGDDSTECVVARLGPDGAPLWVTRPGKFAGDTCHRVVAAHDGGVAATRLDSGSGVMVLRLGADGQLLGERRCLGPTTPHDLAMRADGVAVVTGVTHRGALCQDGADLSGVPFSPTTDGWVSAVAPDATSPWTVVLGGWGDDALSAVTTDGEITWVAGTTESPTIELGASQGHAVGGRSLLLARLDATGQVSGGEVYSPLAKSIGVIDLLSHPDGGVVLVGLLTEGTLRLGPSVVRDAGDGHLFLARIAPDGSPVSAFSLPSLPLDATAAVDATGRVWLAGHFTGPSFSFGPWLVPGPDARSAPNGLPVLLRLSGDLEPEAVHLAPLLPGMVVGLVAEAGHVTIGGRAQNGSPSPPWAQGYDDVGTIARFEVP